MTDSFKVSVIIPVYNAEKFLRKALDSVLSQSISRIEIICINDGSTDNSADILHDYERRCNHLLVVSISNHGAGFARNLGIRLARGGAICFLDPDDYYPDDGILEKLYTAMRDSDAKICGGSAVMLRGNEISPPSERNKKYTFAKEEIQTFEEYQWSYGFWRFLYNRKFLLEHDIWFPSYRRYQDPPFLVEAMIKAGSFLSIPDACYVYRENTSIRRFSSIETIDALKGIRDVLELSYKNNLNELNRVTANHIETWLCLPIVKGILEGREELQSLLDEARRWLCTSEILMKKKNLFLPEHKLSEYRKAKMQERKLLARICSRETLILYGAGDVGKQFFHYISSHSLPVRILFAVTHKTEDTPEHYYGCDILEIKELINDKNNAFVLVATRDNLHREMERQLLKYGYSNYDFIDYRQYELYSLKLEERHRL